MSEWANLAYFLHELGNFRLKRRTTTQRKTHKKTARRAGSEDVHKPVSRDGEFCKYRRCTGIHATSIHIFHIYRSSSLQFGTSDLYIANAAGHL